MQFLTDTLAALNLSSSLEENFKLKGNLIEQLSIFIVENYEDEVLKNFLLTQTIEPGPREIWQEQFAELITWKIEHGVVFNFCLRLSELKPKRSKELPS